jgi:hypothetical protein
MRILTVIAAVCLMLMGQVAWATQNVTTEPNGSVGFNVSTSSVTRLSIVGDRIRRIINPDSIFEMTNDEETGDVFFRAHTAGTGSESGYILTERGVTINFTMQPTERSVPTILITVRGGEGEQAATDSVVGAGVGFSDDIALMMTDIVRDVAAAHVIGRQVPSGRNGRVVRTVQGAGWKATVRLAVAGSEGRLVREQDFYAAGVRAIWIARNTLAASERTFVIVVEEN